MMTAALLACAGGEDDATVPKHLMVDARRGSDDNTGICASLDAATLSRCAFRTVTRAVASAHGASVDLTLVGDDDPSVEIDAAAGEQFPLTIPPRSVVRRAGGRTRFSVPKGPQTGFFVAQGSHLSGVTIDGGASAVGLLPGPHGAACSARISDVSLRGGGYAVWGGGSLCDVAIGPGTTIRGYVNAVFVLGAVRVDAEPTRPVVIEDVSEEAFRAERVTIRGQLLPAGAGGAPGLPAASVRMARIATARAIFPDQPLTHLRADDIDVEGLSVAEDPGGEPMCVRSVNVTVRRSAFEKVVKVMLEGGSIDLGRADDPGGNFFWGAWRSSPSPHLSVTPDRGHLIGGQFTAAGNVFSSADCSVATSPPTRIVVGTDLEWKAGPPDTGAFAPCVLAP